MITSKRLTVHIPNFIEHMQEGHQSKYKDTASHYTSEIDVSVSVLWKYNTNNCIFVYKTPGYPVSQYCTSNQFNIYRAPLCTHLYKSSDVQLQRQHTLVLAIVVYCMPKEISVPSHLAIIIFIICGDGYRAYDCIVWGSTGTIRGLCTVNSRYCNVSVKRWGNYTGRGLTVQL